MNKSDEHDKAEMLSAHYTLPLAFAKIDMHKADVQKWQANLKPDWRNKHVCCMFGWSVDLANKQT